MDVEDGIIWVCGVGDDGVIAFTDFGIGISSSSSKSIRTTPRCSSAATATKLPAA
jgi:hypothetical protein